ncbi:unnamed protein product [Blumeria hordei]|uniref:Bacteriophage T5 Orf172 DNA-binding domain-containing protein n=1 Tax=Blumeria hordei TaxID=2867405 RepID=A0A383V193_BLUHO|nr:unnamed protein product [Blumeria hordei]
MPHIPNTPESLLQRADSKNPVTTCSGITNDGKACRRPIPKTQQSSLKMTATSVSAVKRYCWQHKDQMPPQHGAVDSANAPISTIQERTSVDTIVDRLGLLDLNAGEPARKPGKMLAAKIPPIQTNHAAESSSRPPATSKSSSLSWLCCMVATEDSPRPRPVQKQVRPSLAVDPRAKIPEKAHRNHATQPLQPPPNPTRQSQTGELLSLIPTSTSPTIASLLLAELAKPVSQRDDQGFIYMFWLVPESHYSLSNSTVASPSSPSNASAHKPLDALKDFAEHTVDKKILLKIGRAQNVYRRLNQWKKQCGYNLSLIRYYPYQPTASQTPQYQVTQVPHAHKVERLIHIELSPQRALYDKCSTCGKEHREWFEVEASRMGVKAVDGVIRRWVDWNVRNST